MKKNTQTLENIQKAAMKEFGEKGYMKASLRKICAEAGVTTGALYFFFKDKDELFCSLFKEPLDEIYAIMMEHYSMEEGIPDEELAQMILSLSGDKEDKESMVKVMHVMYQNRDAMLLLLTKGQGSSMENIIDKFVDITTNQYEKLLNKMSRVYPEVEVSSYFAHWMAHEQISSIVYAVTHIEDENEAMKFNDNIVSYIAGGWVTLWK